MIIRKIREFFGLKCLAEAQAENKIGNAPVGLNLYSNYRKHISHPADFFQS